MDVFSMHGVLKSRKRRRCSGWLCLLAVTLHLLAPLCSASRHWPQAITASGTGQQPLSGHAASFAGGAEGELTSTASQVASYLAGLPEVQAVLTVSGSGEEVLAPTGVLPLTGGTSTTVGSGTTTYAWDGLGRLASVTMPDNQIYRYRYDYRTRRTGIEKAALAEAPAQHTAVVFSGGLSLAEYEFSTTPPATLTQPVTSTVRYVRGPDMGGGVGGLLYSHRAGAAKYNLSNGRGDIVAQSDGTGSLTWTASYEAYGKRTKETGTNQDKQRANTKDEDPTGLLNEGFRYRDIETGVWLSRDPAGFVDGPNLYAYVRQNPWTSFDPEGLEQVILVGGPKIVPDEHHDNANDNYLKPAVRHAKAAIAAGQKATVIIYGPSYEKRDAQDIKDGKRKADAPSNLSGYVKAAEKAGATVKVVKSAKDMLAEASAAAGRESVDGVKYFGHSGPQQLLLNYGEDGATSQENINSKGLVTAVPADKLKKGAQARLYGCHTGETQTQTAAWGDAFKGTSISEDISNAYKGHTVMGSADKSQFQSVGQGYNSPTSKGGYQYWQDGKMTKQDPAGQRPSDEKK